MESRFPIALGFPDFQHPGPGKKKQKLHTPHKEASPIRKKHLITSRSAQVFGYSKNEQICQSNLSVKSLSPFPSKQELKVEATWGDHPTEPRHVSLWRVTCQIS